MANTISSDIQKAAGYPYITRNWMEQNKNFFSALLLEKIGMSLILFVIIIVASFNIIGTLTMIVMEKKPGNRDPEIHGFLVPEYRKNIHVRRTCDRHCRHHIGVIIGYSAVTVITKTDVITLPKDVYQVSHLPLVTSGYDILFISLTALGISFLATLYPAWQAAKQDPVEVLRYE